MIKPNSAEDFKLYNSFQSIRQKLMEGDHAESLEKPLAYWALPNDRRLPLAFLGRKVSDILKTPFEDLAATPGIGQKKINSLIKLLHRATQNQPPSAPLEVADQVPAAPVAAPIEDEADFDPTVVSEALWCRWQETVRKHGLENERLGQLAPTLQNLPTVIWHRTLGSYLEYTVSEIRQLRTHGEKRVRVVLEVFHSVNRLLSKTPPDSPLAVRLTPKFVPVIENWLRQAMERNTLPPVDQIRENITRPLLEQIKVDIGENVFELAKGRLGFEGSPQSVRAQSRRLGVTRARVYQLLDDCSKVLEVRWPEGRCMLERLQDRMTQEGASTEALEELAAVRDLLFPEKYEQVEAAAMA